MKKKAFVKHVNQNPELKKWLEKNQEWVMSNPQTVKQLINRWNYMQSLQPTPVGVEKTHPKHVWSGPNKKLKLPKLNLDKISHATQQLTKTMGMIDNMKNIMSIFGPK